MNLHDFTAFAHQSLIQVLDRPGCILYSAGHTLSPGDIYILGLNPGGESSQTIAEHLKSLSRKVDNSYLDECWENKTGSYGPGRAPLQRRIDWLVMSLGKDLRQTCASNLVFMQSRDSTGIDYPGDADLCWKVHEAIISMVRPKLLLTFGNSSISPYGYLKHLLNGNEETIASGHGSWKCKGFKAEIASCKMFVAGIPHLSRYSPINKESVTKWLKDKIGE